MGVSPEALLPLWGGRESGSELKTHEPTMARMIAPPDSLSGKCKVLTFLRV